MRIRQIPKQLYDAIMAQNSLGWVPNDMRYLFGLNDKRYFGVFVDKCEDRYYVRWYEQV